MGQIKFVAGWIWLWVISLGPPSPDPGTVHTSAFQFGAEKQMELTPGWNWGTDNEWIL